MKVEINTANVASIPKYSKPFVAGTSTLVWMLSSSAIIILNKNLYAMGFERPFFVTGMGQAFSAFGGLVLAYCGLLPVRKLPEKKFMAMKLMPIVICATLSKFYGNSSYLYLSVSFIQILKAFTPAITLVLCMLAGLEQMHWALVLSVLLIAAGTASSVLDESSGPAFSSWGLVSFMISSVAEAGRVVGADALLGKQASFNTAEVLIFIGGPTAVILLLGSVIYEDMGPSSMGWSMVSSAPMAFISAFSMSFLLNLSSFIAIKSTSSLTFKVAGCLKNVAVVWYSVVANNERVTLSQVIGYLIAVAGFALFSDFKMKAGRCAMHKNHGKPQVKQS